ncbi:hypothetical protein HMPREF1547_01581 [Blautia sp. KLE 1732]|nr:hypothetical protein HMPREF1547_01581 [Blautia sp. KLE 1732]
MIFSWETGWYRGYSVPFIRDGFFIAHIWIFGVGGGSFDHFN